MHSLLRMILFSQHFYYHLYEMTQRSNPAPPSGLLSLPEAKCLLTETSWTSKGTSNSVCPKAHSAHSPLLLDSNIYCSSVFPTSVKGVDIHSDAPTRWVSWEMIPTFSLPSTSTQISKSSHSSASIPSSPLHSHTPQ